MKHREAQAVGQAQQQLLELPRKSRYKGYLYKKSLSLGAADGRGAQGV